MDCINNFITFLLDPLQHYLQLGLPFAVFPEAIEQKLWLQF
jgi:hypothetical protein